MPRRCRPSAGVRPALLLLVAVLDAAMPVPAVLPTGALFKALLVSPADARDVVPVSVVILDVALPAFATPHDAAMPGSAVLLVGGLISAPLA